MRSAALVVILAGCIGETPEDSAGDTSIEPVTGYAVDWQTDPAPLQAGVEGTFTIAVRDQLGRPIEDLQAAHERMVHTLVISEDLASFQHVHHEDYLDLTADDLRNSTFHFPFTAPMSGEYRLVFDFAHQNQYLAATSWLTVEGEPAQSAVKDLDYSLERAARDLTVALRWDVEPYAGYEASWTVTITDASGADVTDIVQWLGADGHTAVVSEDLSFTSHTHAWFPGMDDVAPGHLMPHLYDGPELPFHYTFPSAGTHKMWVQFARADAPDDPYVADFAFDVLP